MKEKVSSPCASLLAVLIASQASASGVELRGVALGDTCQRAVQVETSLGTQPKSDVQAMLEYNIVAFEDDSIAGQHATYLYRCNQTPGIISRYSITIKTRSESRAWQIYASAKAEAVSRLGIPPEESSSPDATARLSALRTKGLTWTYAFANWYPVGHQSVSLMIEKQPEGEEWSIATMVAADPLNSSDSARERHREK